MFRDERQRHSSELKLKNVVCTGEWAVILLVLLNSPSFVAGAGPSITGRLDIVETPQEITPREKDRRKSLEIQKCVFDT